MMKKPIRIILLIFTLLWLAFLFDTQLIVLRDDSMFTLHYNVPDEMKGKMYTGASWYSNSFMCRQLSFGSGRFEGTTFGTSFRNVEEKPGEWVSHIPTKVWHPFCTWERGPLSIGVHANEEKTSHYELAYAYLFEEKKLIPKTQLTRKKLKMARTSRFLSVMLLNTILKIYLQPMDMPQKESHTSVKIPIPKELSTCRQFHM